MRDTDLVEAHLRRLDDDATLAFVADLWAARGYETSRDGDVVVAERNGDVTTIGVPASTASPDVVVAAGRRLSTDGAAALDAADLRELLQYAVEPVTARELCRRHLGAAPTDLSPTVRLRARRRLHTATTWAPALVLVLVALAGATLVPALTDAPGNASTADTTATPAGFDGVGADDEAGAGDDETGAYRPDEGVADLPGANRSGVTNVSVLADAHAGALQNRSYALWYDESSPRTWTNGSRINRDVDMYVADGRYQVVSSEMSGRSERQVVRRIYYDGSAWYVADEEGNGTTYRSFTDADASDAPPAGTSPFVLRETLVRRYLSTPETRYEGYIDQEGNILYRFVGEGTPDGLSPTGVSDYRVFVVVDDSGLVVLGDVEYTLSTESRSTAVRIRWTYGAFGETTVSPPVWYEVAFGERSNETATPTPTATPVRTPPE